MAIEKVQIVGSLKTNMASNKHNGTLSLQQVLDSILNNDAENDVSEEKSNEEEFDYNDMATEDGQSVEFPDINFGFTFSPDFTLLPCCYDRLSSSINTIKYSKSPYNALKLDQVLKSCVEFILIFLPNKFSEILFFLKRVYLTEKIGILYMILADFIKIL